MKTLFTSTTLLLLLGFSASAQMKIGANTAPNANSVLELESTTQGFVLPRVSLVNINSSAPLGATLLTSTMVYSTVNPVGGSGIGVYYWDGVKWNFVANASTSIGNDWALIGNAGTIAGTNFIGTTDGVDFVMKTANTERMRITSGGSIGINTITPNQKLEVFGTGNTIRVGGIGSGGSFVSTGLAGTVLFSNSSGDVRAITSPASQSILTVNAAGVLSWSSGSLSGFINANNGLTFTPGSPSLIQLGGPLIQATNIAQSGFALTIGGGTINLNDASAANITNIGTTTTTGAVNIGTGASAQTVSIANGGGVKILNLGSNNTTSATNIFSGSNAVNINASNNQPTNINTGTSTGNVSIGNSLDNILLPKFITPGSVFYTVAATGQIATSAAGTTGQVLLSGGGGAPTWGTSSSVVTASNGLTASVATPTDIILGGTLNQATTITQAGFNMIYNLTGAGDFAVQKSSSDLFRVFSANTNVAINNAAPGAGDRFTVSGTTLNGINASTTSATAGSYGVLGNNSNASGYGVQGINSSATGYGVYANNTTGVTGAGLKVSGTSNLIGVTTLGTTSATNGSLVFNNSTNAFTTTLNAGVNTVSYPLTLPTGAPIAGQALTAITATQLGWANYVTVGSDWLLVGNSGTTASTSAIGVAANNNFIGTIDAKDFVVASNNFERMRILSGGQVTINRLTAVSASDLLTVQSSAAYPNAISGYAVSGGIGVLGLGNAATLPSTFAGAGGSFYSTATIGSSTVGAYGSYNSTVVAGAGLFGKGGGGSITLPSGNNTDMGVLGTVGNSTATQVGVAGISGTVPASLISSGVYGSSSLAANPGVYANNTTGVTGAGLKVNGTSNLIGVTTLGTVSTTNGSLVFNSSTSAFTTTLNAGTNTASYALTLPTAAPTLNGQVLSSTIAGVLSWVTPAAGTVTSVGTTIPIYNTGTATDPIIAIQGTLADKAGVLYSTGAGTSAAFNTPGASNTVLHGSAAIPTFSQVNLNTGGDVTGILPLVNGGTNAALAAVSGGVVYSNASQLQITPAGTAGQILLSGGAGIPTWGNASAIVTASNGLTASAATPTNITLGGTLTGITTIIQPSTFNMIYNLTGTGDFQVQKNATDILHVYSANSNVGLANGTATNPAYTFINNTDLGIYRNSANDMRFSTNGVDRLRISKAAATATAEVWVNLASPYLGDVFSATSSLDGDFGVNGYNTAATNTVATGGVYGEARSLNAIGVWGVSNIAGSTSAGGTGVVGTSNALVSNVLVAGSGGSFTGLTTGAYAVATTSGVGQSIYTSEFGNIVRVNYWNGITQYKINGGGSVSTVVSGFNNDKVTLHAPEAPEIYFEDYGESKLINGKAHVDLDPLMSKNVTINQKHPLRVFIQLEGDCKGVYVTNKTTTGFDVVELNAGTSNTNFQWHIVCNRADEDLGRGRISKNADMRFEKAADDLIEKQSGLTKKIKK